MKKAFFLDFDGTITVEDVGFSIIKELAQDGWQETGKLWVEKKISTAECGQKQWDLIKYDKDYVKDFVKKFKICEGFKEFIDEAKKNSYEIFIASDGYDVYINEVLKINGFEDLKVYCNSAVYNNGWNLSFLNSDKGCGLCGNCKRKMVENLKSEGYEVYYVGDGYSDRCACMYADAVFAKSFLKKHCEEQSIPHYNFDNFYDILKYFKK